MARTRARATVFARRLRVWAPFHEGFRLFANAMKAEYFPLNQCWSFPARQQARRRAILKRLGECFPEVTIKYSKHIPEEERNDIQSL